jgi:hypothetical protein
MGGSLLRAHSGAHNLPSLQARTPPRGVFKHCCVYLEGLQAEALLSLTFAVNLLLTSQAGALCLLSRGGLGRGSRSLGALDWLHGQLQPKLPDHPSHQEAAGTTQLLGLFSSGCSSLTLKGTMTQWALCISGQLFSCSIVCLPLPSLPHTATNIQIQAPWVGDLRSSTKKQNSCVCTSCGCHNK